MPLSKMVLKILWVESLSVKIQMKGTEEHFGAGYYALKGCFVNFSLVQFQSLSMNLQIKVFGNSFA